MIIDMGRSSGERKGAAAPECCMCGDCGLSSEIFTCHLCRFRFQHKYCSNMYPQAEIYDICNWCLAKKRGQLVNTIKTTPSSKSTHQNNTTSYDDDHDKRKRVDDNIIIKKSNRDQLMIDKDRSGAERRKINHGKRIITLMSSSQQERSRSDDDGTNGAMIINRKVFRNKVRRYKLLDEVSS